MLIKVSIGENTHLLKYLLRQHELPEYILVRPYRPPLRQLPLKSIVGNVVVLDT